ncbi:MAG: hypothetical protein CO039_01175 [Candidatus Pacebacteria bacterium CG_4_9_14_0_2_um_filter_34_50]|nr:MAG: hypothetical protein CO039_01175 [Candidatus Pacebacteria bacterium CG_4_9_14_0_2_um_filter_34_50]
MVAPTTKANPFARALASGSINPEIANKSDGMSPFALALQENNFSTEDAALARTTFGNVDTKLDFNEPVGFDSPELKKQHEAEQEEIHQHIARLAEETKQRDIFDAAERKTQKTIAEIQTHFLQVALPEARIQMKTATADAMLTDNTPHSLEGAPGSRSFWEAMILKASKLNSLNKSAHDSGSWNSAIQAKGKKRNGPGAAIAGTHGHKTTKAIQSSMHHELTTGE